MVAKIIFLPPSHYKINITEIPQKSKAIDKKKCVFLETIAGTLDLKNRFFLLFLRAATKYFSLSNRV